MTTDLEHDLQRGLAQLAARAHVGPSAPHAIRTLARRRRQRRIAARAVTSASALGLAAVGLASLRSDRGSAPGGAPAPTSDLQALYTLLDPPPGTSAGSAGAGATPVDTMAPPATSPPLTTPGTGDIVAPVSVPDDFPATVPLPEGIELTVSEITWDDVLVGWNLVNEHATIHACRTYAAELDHWPSAEKLDEAAEVIYARTFTSPDWTVYVLCTEEGAFLVQVVSVALTATP